MSEPYAIKMPKLSDTMTEGTIITWEKPVGEKIARNTIVATVETDKAIMDVEVFREGYLSGPIAPVNSVVKVGEPIAFLVADAKSVVKSEKKADDNTKSARSALGSPPAAQDVQMPRSAGRAGAASPLGRGSVVLVEMSVPACPVSPQFLT